MSQLADELREKNDALAERIRKMEEAQRVQAAVAALFVRRDVESLDKQRVIRMALGMGE